MSADGGAVGRERESRTPTPGRPSRDGLDEPRVADAATATHGIRVGRWVSSIIVLVLLAQLFHMLFTNTNFQWDVVGDYFFSGPVLDGLKLTMIVAVLAMVLGIALGIVIAVCRLSQVPLLKIVGGAYVWFFRGTPALVQLIFWFNFGALLPHISLGVPFGPSFVSWSTNSLITAMSAAVVGLGLHEAAFMSEIIRGGILAVDSGQTEAARSLGMGKSRTLFRVVLPQAMRSIVPPTGSRSINMVLATSLVSFIALGDLLYTVQSIYNRTFQVIPLLIVAVLWYLIVSSALYVAQSYLERYYGRGHRRADVEGFLPLVWLQQYRQRARAEVKP